MGGYFDAGDFDIETGSNINVVQSLVSAWELFGNERDETFVDEEQRYVDLHRPDGKPDLLQYIEHGVLNLLAQAENIGFMSQTLSNSVLDNYHHLGDAAAITDGLHYDPSLPKYVKSADGKRSGTPDDMWAFTNRSATTDFNAATMFAAASRVLTGYNESSPHYLSYFVPFGSGYAPFLMGKVVDMFYFPLIETEWPLWMPFVGGEHFVFFSPVFNFADASISVSVVLLLLFYRKEISSISLSNAVDKNEVKEQQEE